MATPAAVRSLSNTWLGWVKDLDMGYFACVMATGIVSTALFFYGMTALSNVLLAIAGVALVYLTVVYALRIALYPRDVLRDLRDPTTTFGFFTFVAGAGVVATRLSLGNWPNVPVILTLIGTLAWIFLTYWIFSMLLFTNEARIEQAVNGSWLLAIVGTESLAMTWVLLTRVEPRLSAVFQFVSYLFWAFGILLYLIFITFIMYRFFFTKERPADLTPPYWINMGAMAITTVAGARLVELPRPDAFIAQLHSFIEGFTVMMWAWGTWWIPLLLIIGVWKYVISRQSLWYNPLLWSVVFPLGMYSTAVQLLSEIDGLNFLSAIVAVTVWVSFAAWVLVAAGWITSAILTGWRATKGATDPARQV